jgi:hypothetical protein
MSSIESGNNARELVKPAEKSAPVKKNKKKKISSPKLGKCVEIEIKAINKK